MSRAIVWLVAAAAAAFCGGAVAGFDWQRLAGTYGAPLNSASQQLRATIGLESQPERVLVAPGGAPPAAVAKGPAAGKGGPGGPPLVTVSKPVVRETVEWDEYTARVDAVDAVDVRARVSGYLNEVGFKDGADVKQGDLLFLIDPRPFERALEQARAELEAAKTKAENARLDVDRGRPLVDRKIMSEKVFDDRSNALRDAQATIKVAEAKVRTAELDLSFTRVTAPMPGRISRAFVSPGNYVIGGGASAPTLLTTLVRQSPVHIYFDVNENNYLKYKRLRDQGQQTGASTMGAAVYVALSDEQGYRHIAELDFVDNRLDQATATIRVRAVLDNKSGLFSPGMFARVRIAGSAKASAVLLPDEAILSDQASKFVYTIAEDGTAQRKAITLGPLVDRLRIVRTGVVADDWVVVKGLQRVRPGQKVTPKREPIKVSEVLSPEEQAVRR